MRASSVQTDAARIAFNPASPSEESRFVLRAMLCAFYCTAIGVAAASPAFAQDSDAEIVDRFERIEPLSSDASPGEESLNSSESRNSRNASDESDGESGYTRYGSAASDGDEENDTGDADFDEEQVLGLAEAERIAESNNFDLRVLNMERDLAEDTIDARLRDFFPSLSLSYRRNRTIARRDFDNGNHSLQLSLSQPVFDGGRTKLAYDISKIDARLARERITESKNQLRFQVRQAYLQLVQEKENIAIASAAYDSARATLARAIVERRQGAITELDYQEIRTEFDRRGLELEQRTDAYNNGRVDFAQLLRVNVDPESQVRPDVKGLDLFRVKVNEFQLSTDELYNIAMESRPDVRQAKIDVMRSRREYLITQYEWLPTVSLTGNYGKSGEEWPPTNTEWGVGVNFTFRVFGNTINTDAQELRTQNETGRGFSTSGQFNVYDNAAWREPHKRNTIELMQARDRKKQLADTVRVEVVRLRRAFYDRRREMELADRSLAVREQRFKIEQVRFRNGEISVSDFLESELELIQARLDLVAGRVNMILAANQTEIDLGLPLDSLKLVDIAEVGGDGDNDPPANDAGSGFRPRTILNLPNAPFEIQDVDSLKEGALDSDDPGEAP